jgi:putative zinc finger/helix-turn-helix YgiT family protein
LKRQRGHLPGEVKGETFVVSTPALVCPGCGYATVDGTDMPEYMRRVGDAYRAKHGLLTSDEIRQRRKRLGMSQAEFADYLRVGVASLKRWEMGKVQDESSDELIRLRTDETEARRNLTQIRQLVKS